MRRAAAVGLVLVGLCGPGAAGAQDAVRTLPETGFFSVRVGDLPARTMTVVADGRRLLLPFTELIEATGWAHGVVADEPFRPEYVDAAVTADTTLRQLRHGELTVQLDSADIRIIGGTPYVTAERLAELLRATAVVDWPTLAVRIDHDQPFPSEVAAESARRRAALVPAVPSRPEPLPYRARWGGLVLDWEYSAAGLDPSRNATFSPTLSTAVWGGELRMGALVGTDARGDASAVQPLMGYSRTFPTSSAVRRVDLGDVLTSGVVGEQLRGFRITNTPHRQADVFGLIPIRADLPPGWEYEVYQDGRLVGFSDAISDGAPPAAVRYGTTGIRIREIAPDGAERTRNLTFAVPFSMAPKGAVRYDLGGGVCRWRTCSWGAFGSVRYGLTHGLTVGGGANYRTLPDSAPATVVPHMSLALGTSRGVSGEVQVERGGAGQATLQFSGTGRLSLSGGARIDRAYTGLGATRGMRFWASDASAAYRIGRLATARLTARLDGQVEAGVQRWSGAAALFHRAGTVELGYSGGPYAPPRWDLRSTYLAPRFRPSLPASLTGGVSFGAAGVERVDAGLSVGLGDLGGITASARWESGHRSPLLELGFTANRAGFRVVGRTSSDRARSPARVLVHGSGSVAWLGMAGLRVSPGRSGGAAGITGRVFYDRDGDGVFTGADSALAGHEVHVGGQAVVTDGSGLYAAWGLPAYEAAAVRLPDAGANLTPTNPARRVRPNPNRPETVDFALVSTRAVSGQITGPDGAIGGIKLELRDAQGHVTETTTFEDGAWYVPRLRPGVYVVSVPENALRALEAVAAPVDLQVAAGEEELIAPPLVVRWAADPVASTDDHSDRNDHAARPPALSAAQDDGRAETATAAIEVHDADTYDIPIRRAPAGRYSVQQPGEAPRRGGRADRSAGSAGAVGAIRRGVLAGTGSVWNGGVEHRVPVLPDGSSAETGAAAELPAGAPDGGGPDEGAPGGEPQREPESEQPPEELTYLVEERRTVRVRRGIARLVPR